MAIASLRNFTVPLESGPGTNQGLLMPKLQYRFRVNFNGLGLPGSDAVELTKQVVSFNRPTVNFADVDLHVYNSTVKIAGKHSWTDISMTIRDDINNNIIRKIGEQMQKQFDFMNQSSARSGRDYKFSMFCQILDGANGAFNPEVIEEWDIVGAYIKEVNYQELNYANGDAVTIQMSIRYDNATQSEGTPGGVGIGQFVGRTRGDTASGAGI